MTCIGKLMIYLRTDVDMPSSAGSFVITRKPKDRQISHGYHLVILQYKK
jgi:hypothetical protein